MPEGPLGGPRPLASDELDGTLVFTGTVAKDHTIAIPKPLREQEQIKSGHRVRLAAYPLFLFEFDSSLRTVTESKVRGKGRISVKEVDRVTTMGREQVVTDKMLISLISVTIPDRRRG